VQVALQFAATQISAQIIVTSANIAYDSTANYGRTGDTPPIAGNGGFGMTDMTEVPNLSPLALAQMAQGWFMGFTVSPGTI
jgi:hypothetical protein